jgi:peptidoglycan/LPS O-acetylase OafA/YrhL
MRLATHSRASTLFYTNFVLAKESGYFDVSTHTKPLMHLWSLALEEQFYIFFPVLLYYATKKNFNIISICISIILLSFFLSINALHKYPVQAFYYPLYRTWELVAGAVLAYFMCNRMIMLEEARAKMNRWVNLSIYNNISSHSSQTLSDALGLLGLIMNLCAIFFLRRTGAFPGWYALYPVVGTLMILAAGENSFVNRTILSNKFMRFIGKISYPLYLWHWALLSFAFIINGNIQETELTTLILFISFVLSYITYKLVETPIRSAKDSSVVVFLLIILMIIVGFISHIIVRNKGYSDRDANLENYTAPLAQNDQFFINLRVSCASPKQVAKATDPQDPYCVVNSDKPKFLVIGDSHTLSFSHSASINNYLDLAMISLSGQPPSINYVSYVKDNPACKRSDRVKQLKLFNSYLNSMLKSYSSIEYIILLSRGPVYFSGEGFGIEKEDSNLNNFVLENIDDNQPSISHKEAFVAGYVEIIRFLQLKGKKVILMIDFPELGIDPESCFKRKLSLYKDRCNDCTLERGVVDARQKEYREMIQSIQHSVPNLLVYDPTPAFCSKDKCYGKMGSVIYYGDDDHLNLNGSTLLINHFKNWFSKEYKN